jgi:hypothetical protein
MAARTPSMAMALASMPPSATSEKTMATTSTKRAPNRTGAMAVSPNRPGTSTKGQKKATRPTNDAITMTARDRSPTRMATASTLTGPPPRPPGPGRW